MYLPYISIIIPMFNAEDTIGVCIESVLNLSYEEDRYEVIVVDNGSTDSSVNIVSQYPVTLVSKPVGTISSVRNYGTRNAKGDVYAFVDSDCIVDSLWLTEALAILRDPTVGAAGSGYLTPVNFTWVEKAWMYESKHRPFETTFLPGGNLIVTALIFKEAGKFNESLVTGEDSDLCLRINKLGAKVMNSSSIKCIHLGNPKTVSMFFKKEYWYGTNMIDGILSTNYDKTLVITGFFAINTVMLIVSSILFYLYSKLLILIPVLIYLIITSASSCYRLIRSKKYSYFFHLNILYFVYFLARSCAVVRSLFTLKQRVGKQQI